MLIPAVRWQPIAGVRIGVTTGVALTAFLIALDYWRRRKVAKRYGLRTEFGARQERRIIVPGVAPARVLAHIEADMAGLPWLYPQTVVREGQVVRAVTKPSVWSFSENLSISISVIGIANDAAVTIVSSPRSIGTLVDYGKGIENVEELKRVIEAWSR